MNIFFMHAVHHSPIMPFKYVQPKSACMICRNLVVYLLRMVVDFIRLCAMDMTDTINEGRIQNLLIESTNLGLFEAFLEAGPQAILQLSIILRTGNISGN